jgi:cytochrome c oxidase subunit 2
MTSEDVIHSLYLPEFRIKQDVLPDRYTYLSFTGDKPGSYHMLCAEFCGTDHSLMTGRVVMMKPGDYADWLSAQPASAGLVAAGEKLFRRLGCSGCHGANSSVHAPDLAGVYGNPVHLADGSVVAGDEVYIRDSILQPRDAIVAGYKPIMPNFKGQVGEDQLVSLVAYIKSLATDTVINDKGQRQ